MSDSVTATAQSLVTMQAAATQQQLSIEMLRQNAQAQASLVEMLQSVAEQQQAALPAGQGLVVDRSA